MAYIDKCYLESYSDYKALVDWSFGKTYITPRGSKITVSDYLSDYKEEDFSGHELPVFNSPTHLDNYLYHNCPLPFIRKWLESRYMTGGYRKGCATEITEDMKLPEYTPCNKIKVIRKSFHKKLPSYSSWFIFITDDKNRTVWYNDYNDFWVLPDEVDEWNTNCAVLQCSIRAIIRRVLKKWKLPAGYTIRIDGPYVNDYWILKTK